MKITILGSGTSHGIPVIACDCEVCRSTDKRDKRLRSSIMIENGNQRLIIDAGPDFRYQMLRAGVKDIRAVLLTHMHKDHTGGLDDVRVFNWIRQGAVDIFCDERTEMAIRKDYSYCFDENKLPGIPDMNLHVVGQHPFFIDDFKILPLKVMHHLLPVTAYRIGSFAYITDVSSIPEDSMALLEGVEVLIISALQKTPHFSHFSLEQSLEVIKRLNVRKAYITHIGHQMGLTQDVSEELPPNVELAYDMLEFEV